MRDVFHIFFKAKGTRPLVVLLCLLLGGLAEGVGLATLLPLLAIAMDGGGGDSPVFAFVHGMLDAIGLTASVPVLLSVVICGVLVKNLLNQFAMTYVGYAVSDVSTGLRRELIENLMTVRWGYFTRQPLGRITNALSNEATRAGQAYLMAAVTLTYTVESLVYVAVSLLVSWKVALVALAFGGLIAGLLNFLVRAAKKAGRRQTQRTAALITHLSDALNNIRPVKAMARQRAFVGLFDKHIDGLRSSLRRQVIAKEGLNNLSEAMATLVLGAGFYLAVTFGQVPFAELAVIGLLLIRVITTISKIQKQYQNAVVMESAYYNVRTLIEETADAQEQRTGDLEPVLAEGCRLVDVSFSHPRTPVVSHVSLDFPVGSVTVLTGPSGAGKTTITDLLLGFLTPDEGEVLLDGRPLDLYDRARWRAMIGYVPQELALFHDTIFANISLGDPALGEEDVRRALKAAGALDFVEALPHGLATPVGEKGMQLSGGQRQRISLARALVCNPRLLILDEVTSALDPESERAIVANISALRGKTTVIAITHKPALLDIADQIYELMNGKVVTVAGAKTAARPAAPGRSGGTQ